MNLKLKITRVPNWRAGFRLNSLFPVFQIKTNTCKSKSVKKSPRAFSSVPVDQTDSTPAL